MHIATLITSTVIAFAASALAAPGALIPRGGDLRKRTYPPTWYFPPYNGTFSTWQSVGCYSGDVALTYNTGMCSCQNAAWTAAKGEMPFSMEKCFAYCKGAGFRYAGIKGDSGVKSCWCGSGVSDDDKLTSEAKCDVPCGEGEGGADNKYNVGKCGGKTTYSVWKDPCYKPFDKDTAAGQYDYVGCFYYYDGSILGYYSGEQSDNLSVDSCLELCASKGYAYAGMAASWLGTDSRGDQCWCGGKIADYWITRHKAYPVDNNQCTILCSASAKVQASIGKDEYQYCGNAWYMSIYFNGNLAESDNCDATPPVSSAVSSAPPATQLTTTVTTPGPKDGTTTIFVTDNKGSTISTSGTVSVIITTPTGGSTSDTPDHKTTTITTPGPTPGTTTKTGPSTDTVIITTPTGGSTSDTPEHFTVTITTPGPSDGTTTKTGPTTDTVIITTPSGPGPKDYTQPTVTRTTPGPDDGTTTIFVTDSKGSTITTAGTVSIIITTPTEGPSSSGTPPDSTSDTPDHKTITVTTPGPTPGTTTKTGPTTDTVIITTPTDGPSSSGTPPDSTSDTPEHFTITVTTPGPSDGTTTKTGPTTDTVIITTPTGGPSSSGTPPDSTGDTPDHYTVTVTTPGPTDGTTTKTGPTTDTVIITTCTKSSGRPGKPTVTVTTPGPKDGTTTKTWGKTVTVVVTTPTGKPTVTVTTPGPKDGTTTKTWGRTVTVVITTPTGKPTVTVTTPGPTEGTTTKHGRTVTVVITTPTGAGPTPTSTCSGSICNAGQGSPLGGITPPTVNCHNDRGKFKAGYHFKLFVPASSNCRMDYLGKPQPGVSEIQAACWNACIEQWKSCRTGYAKCQSWNKDSGCDSAKAAKCAKQQDSCKAANTVKDTKIQSAFSTFCKNFGECPNTNGGEDDGYYRY